MNRFMKKSVIGLGVILLSASLLTACNTVKDGAMGLGHAVGDTAKGMDEDMHAGEHMMMKSGHHKAHHKAHHKMHHMKAKKMMKSAKEEKADAMYSAPR